MSKTAKYFGLATATLLLIIVSISTFAQSPLRGASRPFRCEALKNLLLIYMMEGSLR